MRYFDLHCDTMTECSLKGFSLRQNELHVNLEKAKVLDSFVQCYAVWIPDTLRGQEAFDRFCQVAGKLQKETAENQDVLMQCKEPADLQKMENDRLHGAILTVENGAALGGKLENIALWKEWGVKMCTLTWNGENELGRGVGADGTYGLSGFGREAMRKMEEAGILVDISHASPELFWDVVKEAKKPLVASHSNAQALCRHPRNLTDGQFAAVKASGGLVGLNFYTAFLNDVPERSSMEDILRHAEHFLSLGGEDVLAMGGDMDGSTLPEDMADGLGAIPRLYELFLRHNYSESLLEKIFYGNAAGFFQRNGLL